MRVFLLFCLTKKVSLRDHHTSDNHATITIPNARPSQSTTRDPHSPQREHHCPQRASITVIHTLRHSCSFSLERRLFFVLSWSNHTRFYFMKPQTRITTQQQNTTNPFMRMHVRLTTRLREEQQRMKGADGGWGVAVRRPGHNTREHQKALGNWLGSSSFLDIMDSETCSPRR